METKIFRASTELKDCSLAGSMLTGDMLAFFFFFDSSISQEWLEGCAELSDLQSKVNGQVCVCGKGLLAHPPRMGTLACLGTGVAL